MATRYVWQKRNPPYKIADISTITSGEANNFNAEGTIRTKVVLQVDSFGLSFTNNFSSYDITLNNPSLVAQSTGYSNTQNLTNVSLGPGYYFIGSCYSYTGPSSIQINWAYIHVIANTTLNIVYSHTEYAQGPYDYDKLYFDYTFTGGTVKTVGAVQDNALVGYVSNSSSSAYDTTQLVGGYRYIYQGSDSIDPAAVGYSTQTPMGGQPITINVTPANPTYGGTIQYTYQVQLSGGSWTTIATKTTATSQQYTIPAGTTSFAARVVANDTWGFSSSSYTTGSTITVTNNLPPTAPGSISIGSVVGGQQCTITWTAATDPDGTIASYQLERQVDNGNTWTQIYSGSALTYTDTINADWATVNYRVNATDNDGDSGPYVTGTMQTVNDGWLYFSGPPSDMGEQPTPFDFVFSVGSTGVSPATNISVAVIYDDETIYTGTVASAQQITLNIDTRLTYAGTHDIIVTASADSFLAVTHVCTFTVPEVALPDGGRAGFMEDDAGNTYYPATLARYVIGLKDLDANALFDRVYTGTYTGTGTSGSGNQNNVILSFEPVLVFIQAAAASTATSGYWVNSAPGQSSQGNMIVNNNGTVSLCPVTWDAEAMTLSWYGSSPAAQLNTSGTVYGIIVLGGMA